MLTLSNVYDEFTLSLLYPFSYDLEFTVAQNLVAVSSGNLLYQVRLMHYLNMSVVLASC